MNSMEENKDKSTHRMTVVVDIDDKNRDDVVGSIERYILCHKLPSVHQQFTINEEYYYIKNICTSKSDSGFTTLIEAVPGN